MKKNKKKLDIDWEDSIDKDVSPEDQLKHKKHAIAAVKSKKIRKILFWSISLSALVGIAGLTIGIQLSKPKKALIYWYSKIKKISFYDLNNSDNNLINIKINKNQTIKGTPEFVLGEIANNNNKQNFDYLFKEYATLNFLKNNINDWNIEYENFVIDSISKNILFTDLVFKLKNSRSIEFVIRNFPIKTSDETEKYNTNSIKQKQKQFSKEFINKTKNKLLYKLFLPIDINDNFSEDRINKYKEEVKKYILLFNKKIEQAKNNFYSLIDLSWYFSEIFKINDIESIRFVSNFVTETNNFYSPIIFSSPIEIKNFDNADWKKNSFLSFKGKILTLSTNTEKFKGKKIQYGIYIDPTEEELDFSVPLYFDKFKK
ncbi:hypothetical protein [Metamycoplasma canadense]|uniref:Uncharacterized protein n=1 Tax=Metamycoplasma canadense TaxID=29554 RepID=A0A077L5V6_9BACT|nr:hypothetical protein [Metamycoplasma canadense]BAP39670.1 hypothetical protein MCAN360_0569 [Metamycoplasma canadense]